MQPFLWTLILCAVPPDTAVVCPEDFREALAPWIAHRQAQGYQPILLSSEQSAAEIRAEIRRLADTARLRSIVLVGDVVDDSDHNRRARRLSTPTHFVAAQVNLHWGSEPEIATDNPYGDLDGDGVPEIPVGRLSVRSAAQLKAVVQKIIAYETSTDYGTWHRQINLVAGVGGFGPLADSVVELVTRRLLTDGIPDHYETTMTHASWQSPYCPDPRRFRDVALARLNEGCMLWVYIGHGHQRQLDAVRIPGAAFSIMSAPDVAEMRAERGLPIALMLACHTGAFDLPQDCLAELMLRQPGGPVAVISGSRVTMPYGMAVLSAALMDQFFGDSPRTLGEAFCRAKQIMAETRPDDPNRQLLDALASAVSPMPDRLAEERHEHLALFNLLGDPLLTIHRQTGIPLDVPDQITAGEALVVRSQSEISGSGIIEVVSRRDRFKNNVTARRQFRWSDEFLRSMDAAYQQANDRVWLRKPFQAHGEPFALRVDLPPEARGPCYVRVWIENSHGAAQGTTRVFVHPATAVAGAE